MSDQDRFHCEEAHEIIESPPRWMIRWGMVVMFVIVGSAFVFSFFISVPEYVTGSITITTDDPPVNLIPRIHGKIDTLFFMSHARVKKGTLLGVIKNNADFRSVLELEQDLILSGEMSLECMVKQPWFDKTYDLDESLQDSYITFRSVCGELKSYSETIPNKNAKFYGQQILHYGTMIRELRELLMRRIRQWKDDYIITAPIDGEVVWSPGKLVTPSVTLGIVYPERKHNVQLYGNMVVEDTDYQKVIVGQKVNVIFSTLSEDTNVESTEGVVAALFPLVDKIGYRIVVKLAPDIPEAYMETLTRSGVGRAFGKIIIKERRLVDLYLPLF